jgi:hypothetical protein
MTETAGAAWAASAGASVTSGSYTPTANALQVAICALGNGNNATITALTISDSVSGSWTLRAVAQTSLGPSAAIYVKDAGASPSAQTVTFGATASAGTPNETGIIVRQFPGAAAAAAQLGVTFSSGSSATTATTESITPGTTGSQVVGAYGYSTAARVMTANGSTTIYGQDDASASVVASIEASALSTAGTPVTLGFTAATGGSNCFALAEILPAPVTSAPVGGPQAPPGFQSPASLARMSAAAPPPPNPNPVIPLAETGAGTDALTLAAGLPLTDAGTSADALGITAVVPFTDTGTGSDVLGVMPGLADTGTGADAFAVVQPTALADTGTGSSVLGIMPGLADSGTGADSLAVTQPAPFTDPGAGTDSPGIMPGLTDTDSGGDTLTVTQVTLVPLPDAGSAAEALGIMPGLADAGSGAGTLAVQVITGLPETGQGSDGFTLAAVAALAEQGAGLDGFTLGVPPPLFTIGTLTASPSSSALTAAQSSSALTAAIAAQGTLTAATQTTGGPS